MRLSFHGEGEGRDHPQQPYREEAATRVRECIYVLPLSLPDHMAAVLSPCLPADLRSCLLVTHTLFSVHMFSVSMTTSRDRHAYANKTKIENEAAVAADDPGRQARRE